MNIAIYTNILTPYRKYFYDALYEECKKNGDEFYVILMAETEPNRNWKYDELKTAYTILLDSKTISLGNAYIHINKNLKSVIQKLKPDVLICAGSYLCPGIWQVLKWKNKFKYVTFYWSESHLNEVRSYNNLKYAIREILRKSVYQKFDGFWYAGKLSLQFIKKYAKENCRLQFVPNLVDENKYHMASMVSDEDKAILRNKYEIADEKTVFICPARLSEVKGIDKFIPILAKCKNSNKATVLVAGDGELKQKIEMQAKKFNLDVRLLGFKNQEEMIDLYSLSDVFLLPSLSDPNPLTCIEALWSGLPLFISEHCGNYPEVVCQNENGYVFSYKNLDIAVSDLENIIDKNSDWSVLAKKKSLEIAYEQYKTSKVVKSIVGSFHN
jgi:glycosyltransferase involved in cell wall biosynthesis